MTTYFAIVSFGGGNTPTPKKGPYPSFDAAQKAVKDFREKHGHLAGTYLAATSCRIYEYVDRKSAFDADISDMNFVGMHQV
jgi:hypothetical protein